jgi:hypothetical protein
VISNAARSMGAIEVILCGVLMNRVERATNNMVMLGKKTLKKEAASLRFKSIVNMNWE